MIMSLKQREIKFKPRIKLNHNIYTEIPAISEHLCELDCGLDLIAMQVTNFPCRFGKPAAKHQFQVLSKESNVKKLCITQGFTLRVKVQVCLCCMHFVYNRLLVPR